MPDEPLTSRFGYGAGRTVGSSVVSSKFGTWSYRVFLEIPHQLFGERLEPRLGVPVGGRGISIDRAEVPLAIDQGTAHVEILRQAHERVVGRGVSVRMVIADDFADDLRALPVRAVGRQPHLSHRVQHAPMRRLQTITDIRQRSPNDYAHGVIHVRALHFVFDIDGDLVLSWCVHEFVTGGPRGPGLGRQVWARFEALGGPGARALGPEAFKHQGSSHRARSLR